jgi:hypothetical protein
VAQANFREPSSAVYVAQANSMMKQIICLLGLLAVCQVAFAQPSARTIENHISSLLDSASKLNQRSATITEYGHFEESNFLAEIAHIAQSYAESLSHIVDLRHVAGMTENKRVKSFVRRRTKDLAERELKSYPSDKNVIEKIQAAIQVDSSRELIRELNDKFGTTKKLLIELKR